MLDDCFKYFWGSDLIKVGLTGGIASGKSVVARLLVDCGAHLIDADVLAKDALSYGSVTWDKVILNFGETILNSHGEIDRKKLGKIVFKDSKKREQLNSIVHPWVYSEYQRIADSVSRDHSSGMLVFDLPLLFENKREDLFKHIIVAYVDKQTQLKRVMSRDGLKRSEALDRINAQLPLSQKRRNADYVLDTRVPPGVLRKEVRAIYKSLTCIV